MCFVIAFFSPTWWSCSSESLSPPPLPSDILVVLQNPAQVLFSLLFPGEAAHLLFSDISAAPRHLGLSLDLSTLTWGGWLCKALTQPVMRDILASYTPHWNTQKDRSHITQTVSCDPYREWGTHLTLAGVTHSNIHWGVRYCECVSGHGGSWKTGKNSPS